MVGSITEIDAAIWNPDVKPSDQSEATPLDGYWQAVLEQYLKYVDSAEKVSDRRAIANTFFLTINTAVFTVIGVFWKDPPRTDDRALLTLPLVAVLSICATWWLLIRSYRQLNSAKFKIIGRVEQKLPLRLWGEAEWKTELKEGDPSRYIKLTVAEQWVPWVFAALYIVGYLIVLLS